LRVPWPDRLYLAVRSARAPSLDARTLGLGAQPLADDRQRARAVAACLRVLKERPAAETREVLAGLLEGLGAPGEPDPAEFRLMDWEDVRALAAGRWISFGAHTTHHELLSRQPDDEIEGAIAGSQAEVTKRLGRAPRVFAYPNGRSIDFDARAKAVLSRLGVPWALSTETGRARDGSDPLALPRVCVGADLPFARFRLLARGLWP
jgi:peptidoglycan/xylan/chitin deacetylase (PgdA/CDA1 family)